MKKLLLFALLLCTCQAHAQQLVIPAGHTAGTSQASFSNDNKYIATASDDNTAKLWDAASGKLLFTFYGHKNLTGDIAFSHDSKYLVTHSSKDSVSFIWDIKTGKAVMSFDSSGNPWNQMPVLSNDSRYAFTGGKTAVYVWRISTGEIIRTLSYGNYTPDRPGEILCAPDNSTVVLAERRGYTYCWNLQSGKIQSIIDDVDSWYKISFAAGNKNLVLTGEARQLTIETTSGKLLSSKDYMDEFHKLRDDDYTLTGFVSADNRHLLRPFYHVSYEIRGNDTFSLDHDIFQPAILDIQTKKISRIPSDYKGPADEIIVSQDLNNVVITTDSAYYFLERHAGKYIVKGKAEKAYGDLFHWMRMRKDGRFTAAKGYRGSVTVYNARGSIVNKLTGDIELERKAAFTGNGQYIVSRSTNCWDVGTGKSGRSCLPDETGNTDKEKLGLWNYYEKEDTSGPPRWKVIHKKDTIVLKDYRSAWITGHLIPSSGKMLTYAGMDSAVNVWNRDGTLSLTIPMAVNEEPVFNQAGDKVVLMINYWKYDLAKMWDRLQKELDGEEITVDTLQQEGYLVQVVDLNSGSILLRIRDAGEGETTPDIHFSNRSDYLVMSGAKYSWLFNTRTWQKTGLPINCYGARTSFDSSGERMLVSNENKTFLFHIPSSKVLYTLPGSTNYSNFSDDSKLVLTASADKSMRVWNTNDGKLLYTYFPFTNGEYLVTDEQGHFDGSETARKKLYFNCNNELVDLLQVKDQLWVPGLAERIMKNEEINAPKLSELNICGLTPVMRDLGIERNTYRFQVTPRKGGLGETIVYVNNIEVKKYMPAELVKEKESYRLSVPFSLVQPFFIKGSDNEISAKAFAAGNKVASRGVSIQHKATAKNTEPPNLYAVMVGVSDYKGDELDLKFAAKDATDLSAALAACARKLLNTDGNEHVFMYDLVTADKRYLMPEKNAIRKTLAEIGARSKPNDILLVFFAGHGVMEGLKKQFYFLTSDASRNSDITATGISTAELTEWMKPANIKAQKRILILDACNSGQAINDIVHIGKDDEGYAAARSDANSQQVKAIDKLNERSGMFILSASASNQSAYEFSRYSQGLLTYALLKVMKEQPSVLDDDRYLDVNKWFHETEKKVTELVSNTGNRQDPKISATNSFNIGIVDAEVIASIQVAQEKPLFSASNFQNNDQAIADDDLGLNEILNNTLFTISSRSVDSKISYITVTHSPDAWTLSGRYEIKEDMVTVRVNLKQNKIIKHRFEITGKQNEIGNIAAEIVKKAADIISL